MADERKRVKIWFDPEGDYLEVIFEQAPGYFQETENDQVMEKVDEQGRVLGFSVTYYESNRPRQYYPDFIVIARDASGREVMWLAETKGEVRPNTALKSEAARLWCEKMSGTEYGQWRYLFLQQEKLEMALARGVQSLAGLAEALVRARPEPQLRLFALDDARIEREAFKTLLPLYSLKAAAGYLGEGEAVEAEAWIEADGVGRLDDQRFVCRAVGRSMEPGIRDGDYVVFRARPAGTRLGKIVLVQYRGPADPDTSGSYAVKCYASGKQRDDEGGWKHTRVILDAGDAESVQAIGPATVRGLTGADWDGSSCQRFNIDPVAFFGAFRGPTVGAGEGGLSAETAFRARPHSLFVSGRTQLSNVTSLIGRSSLFLPKKEAGPDGKSGPFREQNPLLDAAPQTYAMGCTRITAFLHRNRGDRVPVITCPTSHQNWGQALYPGNLLPAVGADVRRRPGS